MTTKIVTPPTEMPVTLEDAKLSLKEDTDDKDALISAWIEGITGYAEFKIQRKIIQRQMRLTLDAFPVSESGGPGVIFLDFPPAVSVDEIRYVDEAGALQILDPQDYTVDLVSEPGCVVPAPGKSWPLTFDKINSVECDFTAGMAADSTEVPKSLRLFVLAKLTEQFDPAARVEKDTVQSSFIDHLLDEHVFYG